MNLSFNTKKALIAAAALLFLSACSNPEYRDGSFDGKSSPDEDGGVAHVTVTLKDSRIVACDFQTYEADGRLKDENYASFARDSGNFGYYQRAQHAVEAMKAYQEQITALGTLKGIDKISGATISYNQFTEAVLNALAKAEK